jgi:hypothetical protein
VSAAGGLSPAKRALLERALRERRAQAAAQTIPRLADGEDTPLSFAQHRMWFLQQWAPEAPTFNGARAIRIRGPLDAGALAAAFETVLERHESLRTVVRGDTEPHPVVLPPPRPFELAAVELGEPGELDRTLRELSREPFDLARDLMLRATLIRPDAADGAEHVLLIRMHHIAADAHSDRVLFDELGELYDAALAGRPAQLPELPIRYADYAAWQRDQLPAFERLTGYWAGQLEGSPALLRLPTDRPRPAVQRHQGSHRSFSLPASLAADLTALGRDRGATFFMVMLAAFSTLLYRISGEDDIVIGSPIAARNRLELQGLIGFFTNTLALRVRLGGNPSFEDVLARARETALGAYEHQDLPFDKVVEVLRPKRDPSYNPLFVVNFRAQATERPALRLTGTTTEPIAVDIGFSRFDMALELESRADALGGYFEYDRDLFEDVTVDGFVEDLDALLTAIVTDPTAPVLTLALPHGRRTKASAARSGTPMRRRERAR